MGKEQFPSPAGHTPNLKSQSNTESRCKTSWGLWMEPASSHTCTPLELLHDTDDALGDGAEWCQHNTGNLISAHISSDQTLFSLKKNKNKNKNLSALSTQGLIQVPLMSWRGSEREVIRPPPAALNTRAASLCPGLGGGVLCVSRWEGRASSPRGVPANTPCVLVSLRRDCAHFQEGTGRTFFGQIPELWPWGRLFLPWAHLWIWTS